MHLFLNINNKLFLLKWLILCFKKFVCMFHLKLSDTLSKFTWTTKIFKFVCNSKFIVCCELTLHLWASWIEFTPNLIYPPFLNFQIWFIKVLNNWSNNYHPLIAINSILNILRYFLSFYIVIRFVTTSHKNHIVKTKNSILLANCDWVISMLRIKEVKIFF